MRQEIEIFKEIEGSGGFYQVSNSGRIKSNKPSKRWKGERFLSLSPNGDGYCMANICGKSKTVHSLVLKAFVGNRPNGYQINHKNSIRHDNRVSNLEYVTPGQNCDHAFKFGNWKPRRKLNDVQYIDIYHLKNFKVPYAEIAKKYEIHEKYVIKIFYKAAKLLAKEGAHDR